jgi:recombination protein RecT
MATTTTMTKVKAPTLPEKKAGKTTIQDLIMSYKDKFAQALPEVMTPERFTRLAINAISRTPELARCSGASLIGGMLTSAQLGLEPNTPLGQAYMIPYHNSKNGTEEAQFQIGYKGYISLFYRDPKAQSLEAHCVHENDTFEYSYGLTDTLKHIPAQTDRGRVTHVYAVYHLNNGGFGFAVMSTEDINKHRDKFSKAAKYGPWKDNWDEMAKKTVIKKALKYAPMSTEFISVMSKDESKLNLDITQDHAEVEVEPIEAEYDVNEDTGEISNELTEAEKAAIEAEEAKEA